MFGRKEAPPSEEHFRKWTQVRNRGENRFLFTRILIAAGCGILSFLLIGILYEHKHFDSVWDFVLGNGIGWLVGGLIAGSSEWASNEKRYQREMTQFASSNYESPEQTLKQLQRGIENGR